MQLPLPGSRCTLKTVQSPRPFKYKPCSSVQCNRCPAQHDRGTRKCENLCIDRACRAQQHAWLSRALAGAVSLGLLFQGAVSAEEMSIAFPASADPEIRRAQQTMVESWAYVQALYFDPSFSHTDWSKALQDSLAASFKAESAAEVNDLTNQLLAMLGDPFTRLLQGDKAVALAAQEQGKLVATGMGLQQVVLMPPATAASTADTAPASTSAAPAALEVTSAGTVTDAVAVDRSTAAAAAAAAPSCQPALVVSFVVDDSPAAVAGVSEGDLLIAVAGQPVAGQELRQVYTLLSRESDVTLIRQQRDGSSNSSSSSTSIMQGLLPAAQLTAAPDAADSGRTSSSSSSTSSAVLAAAVAAGYSPKDAYTVHLKPEPLEFDPVQFGTIDINKATGNVSNASSSSSALKDVAYLKILSFSTTAPQEVAQALVDIQYEALPEHGGNGLAGIIVDLRDNPGGVVEAGVSVAQDFLSKGQVLCIAVDRSGQEERVVLPTAHTLVKLPTVVLVNKSTASTSELIAGALHDELSAPLIGTTTYGKGRSQRVVQLADGTSTLLVSTLKYFTPHHTEIDRVGLKPDEVCDPPEVVGQRWTGGRLDESGESFSLLDDPCIKLAAEKLVGTAL